jgi:hypothetical protein
MALISPAGFSLMPPDAAISRGHPPFRSVVTGGLHANHTNGTPDSDRHPGGGRWYQWPLRATR